MSQRNKSVLLDTSSERLCVVTNLRLAGRTDRCKVFAHNDMVEAQRLCDGRGGNVFRRVFAELLHIIQVKR